MKGPGGDYLQEVSENFIVRQCLSKVSQFMTDTKAKCEDFKNSFAEYSHLWTQDVGDAFENFLNNESL